jgi:hypothetical protein
MHRLSRTLLASIGGGILLGAGLKLGELRSSQEHASLLEEASRLAQARDEKRKRLKSKQILRRLETRLARLEDRGQANERRAESLRALRAEIAVLEREIANLASNERAKPSVLDNESRGSITEEDRARRSGREATGSSDQELARIVADNIEARVMKRIRRLEENSENQAATVQELKECAARTEKSVQRLVAGLDRWMAVRPSSRGADDPDGE